jgi:sugar lactone lactonase YvrE
VLLLLLGCSLRSTSGADAPSAAAGDFVTTLAGSGMKGYLDGPGAKARFSGPYGVAVAADGTLYVADAMNQCIRKVTPEGEVSTLAGGGPFRSGSADGEGAAAQFLYPTGVAVDAAGTVYATDSHNHRVVRITPEGVVSTLAGSGVAGFTDGRGTAAQFDMPKFVAVGADGSVYVTDMHNHAVRKISPDGDVTTLAGGSAKGYADGPGETAQFDLPMGIAVDGAGTVYVGDYNNNVIRKISADGVVSTLAGGKDGWLDATGVAAEFDKPADVAVDAAGNVYVAGNGNHRVRRVSPGGVVSTVAGSTYGDVDGEGAAAKFSTLWGIAVDAQGAVYLADAFNNRIRKIAAAV